MSNNHLTKNISDLNIGVLSSNIRHLMSRSGTDPLRLYEATGIAVTTINNLKRGLGNPTLSTLMLLADFFSVSIGDLTEKNLSSQGIRKVSVSLDLIDLVDIDDYFSGRIHNNQHSICVDIEPDAKDKSFAIKLNNSSMAPFFEKGTVFILGKNLVAHDGDLVLVKIGKNPACFRRVLIEEDASFFSPVSGMLGKEPSRSKNFHIYGVVLKAIQYFHE